MKLRLFARIDAHKPYLVFSFLEDSVWHLSGCRQVARVEVKGVRSPDIARNAATRGLYMALIGIL